MTGQALAAVTTAGIGAYLGGAVGTVSGAAIASVVTTIGDAVYQRSLERTRDGIKARLRQGRSPASDAEPTAVDRTRIVPSGPDAEPTALDRTSVVPSGPGAAPTAVAPLGAPDRPGSERPPEPDETPTRALHGLGDPATRVAPADQGTRALDAGAPTELAETPAAPARSPWKRYGVYVATGLLVFLIALVAITGIERVKGSPLSGGGPGTSVGSVLGHPTPVEPSTSAPTSGAEPSSATETPTATTTSAPERATPSTTSKAPGRQRATSTTSERPGGGLLPGGLLPGG